MIFKKIVKVISHNSQNTRMTPSMLNNSININRDRHNNEQFCDISSVEPPWNYYYICRAQTSAAKSSPLQQSDSCLMYLVCVGCPTWNGCKVSLLEDVGGEAFLVIWELEIWRLLSSEVTSRYNQICSAEHDSSRAIKTRFRLTRKNCAYKHTNKEFNWIGFL